ncbi:hypothetical protein CBR_g50311 [Chara braunii]|uniref:Palmitoyl-protein thioesterase 1 n=1 Tax=Chara braunii TaxID=69332 RepID=A0A388K5H5_CHABU|nr:hypothetical protein CBR_g50311 [Chara braunii]|eukprot:GBG65269.1 hypothetical protein CBR_g50311 [Chara braunii]
MMSSVREETAPPSLVMRAPEETMDALESGSQCREQQVASAESEPRTSSSSTFGWDKEMIVLTFIVSIVALAVAGLVFFHGDIRIAITGLWDPVLQSSGSQILMMPSPSPLQEEGQAFGSELARPMRTWHLTEEDARFVVVSEQPLLPPSPAGEQLPFVVLHGIGDQCSNPGLTKFVETLNSQVPGANGLCLTIGNGAADSWTMPLKKQVDLVCESIKQHPQLKNGFNIVGLSQGNLIGRGYVEWCADGPPVNNFISIGGPHAGTAAVPLCTNMYFCRFVDLLLRLGIYSRLVQDHLAPTGYVKIPNDLPAYLRGCKFLPFLNNEHEGARNASYARQMASLNRMVLIMFEQDRVIIPKETAWFGWYLPEDGMENVVPANETRLYKEDWIGLRELDEAGRVVFAAVPGDHLEISEADIQNHVVPHLMMDS